MNRAEQIIAVAIDEWTDSFRTSSPLTIAEFIACRLRVAGIDLDYTYGRVVCANGCGALYVRRPLDGEA